MTAGCEKELDFKYHDVESPPVIEATLTQTGASVRLTHTTPMDEAMDLSPITGAEVILRDITEGSARVLSLRSDGCYGDERGGIAGHEYEVEVNTGGTRYLASSKMKGGTEIVDLSFQWIKMPYDYVAVLQISFREIPGDENSFWIRILRNGEPYKWSVVDRRIASGGIINYVTLTSRRDIDEEDEKDKLIDGDCVSVLVTPIDQEMVDYLTALSQDSNGPQMWAGGFCLGYFLASTVAESSIIYRPDEMTEFK